MTDPDHLWQTCAATIRAEVSDAVWQSTFNNARPVAIVDDTLVLSVPNAIVKERVEGRYLSLVRDALDNAEAGTLDLMIDVRPDESDDDMAHDIAALIDDITPSEPGAASPTDSSLNPKYTFETFVTGQSNRFAQAASLAVAETPAKSYNPLFIYGDAGLGKTHLLQAIGHYVLENYPDQGVQYVSTETFLNEFVDAIRTNNRASFKRRYRDIDVLIVDDIQFIEGKEGLQEEFFHTFNTLHQANRQIVISSDRPPDAISTLEDRLRSRFKMGLITDIQAPDLETRLAILRKKAEHSSVPVPDPVLEFIASHITDNIRELEGALIRVCAYASLTNKPLDSDLAKDVLRDIVTAREPRTITPDLILDATSKRFGFTIEEIKGARRHRPLVTARQIAMYVSRELTELSYPAIAREFGGRDHTTVIHAVDKISKLMAERRQIYDQVTEMIQAIKNGDT
ncbi:MAG: chromosomal replication initiator protein DnaA [Acidimicrobiia bacterium]|nr:chromosomal replication initiator protein DnaA [Acidimicrobiia bacterium]